MKGERKAVRPGQRQSQMEELHRRAVTYYLSLFDPSTGGFRYCEGLPPSLMATAYCVLGLEFSGGIDGVATDRKRAITSFLLRGASPDGNFRDPRWVEFPHQSSRHPPEYFEEELTTFCQQALDALIEPAPPARRWPEGFLRPGGISHRFESLAWDNAWRDSNRVMFVLAQLCHDAERHGRAELLSVVDVGLDWLDLHQSPRTGLWDGPSAVSLANAMAATFHFTFFYFYRGRSLRYAERIIDSCLALQERHGLFSGRNVGHTCLDYDALDLLAKAALLSDHRSGEIAEAMGRARSTLLDLSDPATGAFVHCREQSRPRLPSAQRLPLAWRLSRWLPARRVPLRRPWHTGSPLLSSECSASNAFSTWFRLLAVELADPGTRPGGSDHGRRFRRLPFLGFHEAFAIAGTGYADREIRPGERDPGMPARVGTERGLRVTAVIPARNAADHLPDALLALRRQTYPGWEAIVVNDGSDDDTGRIAEEWAAAEPRIRAVHQEPRGLAAARNTALHCASGELIHCLDADDSIDPTFYEQVIRSFANRPASSGIGECAVTRVALMWPSGELARMHPAPRPDKFQFRELARRNIRQPVCHVFERRILDATGVFDESLRHCQDWDLWLRFARVGATFHPVDGALARYRLRPDSLSSNWEAYLRHGSAVMQRALAPDPRCREPVVSPLDDPEPVHVGRVLFWQRNLLRAVNRADRTGVERIFQGGREILPEGFWADPERYGVRPAFDWAYDAPGPESRTLATLLNRGGLFLSALAVHWPELGPERSRAAARALLCRALEIVATRRAENHFSGSEQADAIAGLAASLGRLNPLVLGLRTLLVTPPPLRPPILRLGRLVLGGIRPAIGAGTS
ncbi:MAG: glycosyltransferase [Longimicrobiales bacterium]